MDAIWDTKYLSASANDIEHMTGLGLESNIKTAGTDKVFYYHRGLKVLKDVTPVLILIHGYPQSNFMWRHLIPLLPPNIPLFIPDIPGYGRSSPLPGLHDKLSTGVALLNTLNSLLSHRDSTSIVIAGHDRGARICHRLAVSLPQSNFKILGAILLDIVPTLIQWQTFGSASASVGSFHWPLLANVSLATSMIKAQGGDFWVKTCLERWAGKSAAGQAKFRENDAINVYAEFFKQDSVIQATCDDYRAGAEEDVRLQEEDQQAGRKVDVDVLVLYSADYLGKRYDVEKVWKEWMGNGTLQVQGVGGGVGHFIAEEAPEETAEAIVRFYNGLS